MKKAFLEKASMAKILTYSGSLPFIFLTYLGFANNNQFFSIDASLMLMSYAAVILSFIAGMHFAYAILQDKINITLLFLSNVVALISWVCLLVNFHIALMLMVISYVFSLIIDFIAYKNLIIARWFFNLRLRISFIVTPCLLLNFLHIS